MEYRLFRFASGSESTLGILYAIQEGKRKFRCFTLEDQAQKVKVAGETRIPAGRYEIKLRNAGGIFTKYTQKYSWHKGVLHLQDVPNFTWIYIHIGNTDDHTSGCILVGDAAFANTGGNAGKLGYSESAYKSLYQEMLQYFERAETVYIKIVDIA